MSDETNPVEETTTVPPELENMPITEDAPAATDETSPEETKETPTAE